MFLRAQAAEGDLTFRAGSVIEVISTHPGQGWLTGRLEGRTGIFPANYCAES